MAGREELPPLKSSISSKEPAIEFPGRDERPCFGAYPKPFRVNGRQYNAGIYSHTVTEKEETTEDGKSQKKEILCDDWFMSYLRVVAIVHTADLKEYSYLLEYLPHGKTANNRILFPQALLVGRLDDMMRTLRDIGVIASYEYKKSSAITRMNNIRILMLQGRKCSGSAPNLPAGIQNLVLSCRLK
jgi:hypothetical protein